jgi:Ca2+-binding EF-hand superfamily protein
VSEEADLFFRILDEDQNGILDQEEMKSFLKEKKKRKKLF